MRRNFEGSSTFFSLRLYYSVASWGSYTFGRGDAASPWVVLSSGDDATSFTCMPLLCKHLLWWVTRSIGILGRGEAHR